MKKSFLILTAFATLVACSKDEVVTSQPAQAIAFGDIFVEAPTRAAFDGSYNSGSLTSFEVYGTISNKNGAANIFNQEEVTMKGSAWTYDEANIQYWIPGNSYNFTAVVDGNASGTTSVGVDEYLMPTSITMEDASQQKDVLLAKSKSIHFTEYSTASPVTFAFDHLMSKAKFSVKNSATTDDGYSYKVSGITIKEVALNGVYDIASQTWNEAPTPATYDLLFGNAVTTGSEAGAAAESIGYGQTKESNYERLLIPTFADEGATDITIELTYELFYQDAPVVTETKYLSADVILEAGHAYNFVIDLSNLGKPAELTLTDEGEM